MLVVYLWRKPVTLIVVIVVFMHIKMGRPWGNVRKKPQKILEYNQKKYWKMVVRFHGPKY
ncbi:hypothetical protein D3C83_250090 [compost metagenome]